MAESFRTTRERLSIAEAELDQLRGIVARDEALRDHFREALADISQATGGPDTEIACACPGTCIELGYCPLHLGSVLMKVKWLREKAGLPPPPAKQP